MFAVFALFPTSIHPTGAPLPPNVPNEHYQPWVRFEVRRVSDWYMDEDAAKTAKLLLKVADAAATIVLDERKTPHGLASQEFTAVYPSADVLPMKRFA